MAAQLLLSTHKFRCWPQHNPNTAPPAGVCLLCLLLLLWPTGGCANL